MKHITILLISVLTAFLAISNAFASNTNQHKHFDNNATFEKIIQHNDKGLNPKLLKMGLNAFHYVNEQGLVHRDKLTIVDFNQYSKYKRLWVIDLSNGQVLAHTFVENGQNSGMYRGVRFSNQPGSHESSLGVYVTGNSYYGNLGYSMRVKGLEDGINNNAYRRNIVMHGAKYVNAEVANKYGRVGNSYGCFSLDSKISPKIINMIKDGSVLFAYGTSENQDPTVNSGIRIV